jgi:hypothetical protein
MGSSERRIIQDLSFPWNDPLCPSINDQIDIEEFRCDWGTFNDIRTIVNDNLSSMSLPYQKQPPWMSIRHSDVAQSPHHSRIVLSSTGMVRTTLTTTPCSVRLAPEVCLAGSDVQAWAQSPE